MSERILAVDDDSKIRKLCLLAFQAEDYEVTVVDNALDGLNEIKSGRFDLVLLDMVLPGIDGLEALSMIKEVQPDLMVIMITGYPQIDMAVKAIKQGAYDYIPKPFLLDEIRIAVDRALDHKQTLAQNLELKQELNHRYESSGLIGSSPKMLKIFRLIESLENIDCTILIEGESGTGKEILASAIHAQSTRSNKPFMAINCSALPDTLLESELFGYEKGSFTGAITSKRGLFEAANGGTIFLDEISETSPAMQAKLLRIVEDGCSRRLGSTHDTKLDVRLISATNKILQDEVQKKNFREDLFYRLDVVKISLPPLRERRQDIPPLLDNFINRYNSKFSRNITGVTKEAMALLMMYDYPGNVRELENITERAVILSREQILQKNLVRKALGSNSHSLNGNDSTLKNLEKNHIIMVLNVTRNNKSKASKILGIDRKTLYHKAKKYGISLIKK